MERERERHGYGEGCQTSACKVLTKAVDNIRCQQLWSAPPPSPLEGAAALDSNYSTLTALPSHSPHPPRSACADKSKVFATEINCAHCTNF